MGVAAHGAEDVPLEGVLRSREVNKAAGYPGGAESKPFAPESGCEEEKKAVGLPGAGVSEAAEKTKIGVIGTS